MEGVRGQHGYVRICSTPIQVLWANGRVKINGSMLSVILVYDDSWWSIGLVSVYVCAHPDLSSFSNKNARFPYVFVGAPIIL